MISSETVALVEIVKNAYDADAKNVLIRFTGDMLSGSGSVIVYDDGHGMSLNTVNDAWMVIATTNKKTNHYSESGKRRVLGEKGIGRFAASRLAHELELVSKRSNINSEVYAFFDWTQFDNDELFLDQVSFSTAEREPEEILNTWELSKYIADQVNEKEMHGTILKMNLLNHRWEKSDFVTLQRGLSRLVSPFKSELEFNIHVEVPSDIGEVHSTITPPEIINYPHYTVIGNVKEDGEFQITYELKATGEAISSNGYFTLRNNQGNWELIRTVDKIYNESESETDAEYREISCGPFKFELRVWDRDELDNINQKLGTGIRAIRKDLDAIAGINIYRDDFRVLPYGEPDNDWLRLDLRRVQTPAKRLSNNQITGFISITADGNPELKDRSNREGLDNNLAYSDLQDVLLSTLTDLENERYSARRKHSKRNGNDKKDGLFDTPDFNTLRENLSKDGATKQESLQLISDVEKEWKEKVTKFKDVLSQYHALATLGGIIDKVLHDGRQPLSSIQTQAGLGREKTRDLIIDPEPQSKKLLIEAESIKDIETKFSKIVDQASILRDVFNRVEPFGGRKRGRPKKFYIEDIIDQTFRNYQRELNSNNIKVFLPDSETLVSLDITELSEIVTNLLTNSIYWLGHVPADKRSIRVSLERKNASELQILFSDTGPGIEAKHRKEIFDPYFSTKPDGHGLGLSLVGEIVKDYYNGSVELLDTGSYGGATFRIILRKRI